MTHNRRKRHRPPPPAVPLHVGTRLHGRYLVRSVLGTGAFDVVYRVHDEQEEQDLAVKEYYPASLAARRGPAELAPRQESDAENYALGLRFFTEEASVLATFDHPSLIKVHDHWQDNGTAYMAMPLVNGRTLSENAQARWRSPREANLRVMMDILLDVLDRLHAANLQHRDVAPQTVVLEPDGRPLLMDMNSPRRVTSALGETGPTGPRDGYAPIELYGQAPGLERGPWTDLYSLGATVYFLMCGRNPPPAHQRTEGEPLARKLLKPDQRHSLDFLCLVDWMMAPRPADRPQSVAELRAALAGGPLPEAYRPPRQDRLRLAIKRHRRWIWAAALLVGLGLGAAAVRFAITSPKMPWNNERGWSAIGIGSRR